MADPKGVPPAENPRTDSRTMGGTIQSATLIMIAAGMTSGTAQYGTAWRAPRDTFFDQPSINSPSDLYMDAHERNCAILYFHRGESARETDPN